MVCKGVVVARRRERLADGAKTAVDYDTQVLLVEGVSQIVDVVGRRSRRADRKHGRRGGGRRWTFDGVDEGVVVVCRQTRGLVEGEVAEERSHGGGRESGG